MSTTTPTLSGKVVLVTGGAGGLGAAICKAFADAGAAVVIGYNRSAEAAIKLAAELPSPNSPVSPASPFTLHPSPFTKLQHCALPAPVTNSAALKTLANEIEQRYGRLDVLVNCAGTTRFVAHPDLDGLDDDLIDEVFATNVRGAIAAVRAMRHLLAKNNSGVVINISSIAAVSAMGSNIAYCASKAALDNLTKSLARALAPAIRVVSVSPGLVDTEFVKKLDVNWRNDQVAKTPLGRLTAPDEVAQAVLAAVTHFTFSTGNIFAVDGGRPLA